MDRSRRIKKSIDMLPAVLYYLISFVLFIISILRIVHLNSPSSLPLMIGKWEVVSFWILSAWLLLAGSFYVFYQVKSYQKISKRTLVFLIVIFLSGFFLRAFVAPHTERLYFDEDIYLNIAQNIRSNAQALSCNNGYVRFGKLHCLQPILNKEPNGWPFLLSLVLNLASPEKAGRWLSIFLSSLSVLLVFLIGKKLFGDTGGLWAAFVYSLMPIPIKWAPTVEPNTAFTFFFLGSFYLCLKEADHENCGYLLFPWLVLTVQMRPEGILVLPAALLLIFLGKKEFFMERKNLFFWGLSLILLIPYGIHLFAARHSHWGSRGPKFSLSYFLPNLAANLRFFIQPLRFPPLDTFFFLIGFFTIFMLSKNKRAVYPLILWLIMFFSIYLFFYAGSYNYGVDVRFSLPIHPVLAIFSAAGILFLCEWFLNRKLNAAPAVFGLLLFGFFFQLSHITIIGQQGWQARADHDFITNLAPSLPANAVVFTHDPSEVMDAGRWGVQTFELNSVYLGHLFKKKEVPYFYFDAWCSTPEFKTQCKNILKKYKLLPVSENTTLKQKLILFRIVGGRSHGKD